VCFCTDKNLFFSIERKIARCVFVYTETDFFQLKEKIDLLKNQLKKKLNLLLMGCLKLTYEPVLKVIAHTSNTARSREGKIDAGLYKYKYNGKEYQDELGLNMYDYGARNYDPAIGRWGATDNKAEFYFANSPYVYALNTPTNAIDPDGNLVIFINGLGGGGANYWRNYDTTKDNWLSQPNKVAFDLRVSDRLNDQNRRYYDGSPGTLLHNLSSSNRYSDGYAKGKAEAAAIIGSLARDPQGNITETIKIITHSMGGVYGKGFVKALKEYIKNSKDPQVRKALITLVADFDPFQAGSKLGKADSNTYTQQFINEGWSDLLNAGWLANQEQEGADEIINNKKKSSHFIETFVDNISNLQEGTYTWDKDKEEWICTTCN